MLIKHNPLIQRYTSLIGYYSGKVISYNTRSTRCSRCEHGHPKRDHDCRENFDGSARAMEPDMSVELVTNNKLLKEENVIISVLIGDDDSSAIAAIRREALHEVEKWSDTNHAKKNFNSRLYKLGLSAKVVNYFGQMFVRVLNHNKGNVEAAAEALSNIVPHAYGNHDKCGEWLKCREKDNNFIYKDLPKKQPLTDPKLFENLNNIFDKLSTNASKLAPCGSSQSNESFNNIVINKHPKINFMAHLNHSTIEKQKRAGKIASKERKEGTSYQTECDLDGLSELIKNFTDVNENSDLMECELVIFDLETTGISNSDEICQISASYKTKTFNVYMLPTKMNYHASKVTGLHIKQNKLYLHNTCLESFSDTLPILKKHLPEIKKEKNGLKLTNLALKFLGDNSTEGAHNGETDVRLLKEVLQAVGVKDELVKQMAKTTISILEKKQTDPILEKNKLSLMKLKPEVSAIFITKMANSGISLEILEKAFVTSGEAGVKSLLSENVDFHE
ncbi:uncharacterized protein LOC141525999 [Cotesia typhae]|uniref:uncharacterized protein LOC141525999 n=1 Tax=Cotesia typhae TaxID=2053667 RepID=UPI003D6958A5